MRILLIAISLLCVSVQARPYGRQYRYYLNAARAEEILSAISLSPRLYDDRWLDLIGEKRGQKYEVQRGDTLWSIAGNNLGNSRLWRKLWEVNQFLTNPHELEVGQLLEWYHERPGGPWNPIPFVRLIPPGRGYTDLDEDAMLSKNFNGKSKTRSMLLDADQVIGEVRGSYAEGEWLSYAEPIYIEFVAPERVKKGDRFQVVKLDRVLTEVRGEKKKKIGALAHIVGDIRVIGFGDKLVRAEVTKLRGLIERGDGVVRVQEDIVEETPLYNPAPDLTVALVGGDDPDRKRFGPNDLVVVDRGLEDGVKEGLVFRVYMDGDPHTKSYEDVDPTYKGELQVVTSSRLASLAYIRRAKQPLEIGDVAVPTQAFEDPEPPPRRYSGAIEIE